MATAPSFKRATFDLAPARPTTPSRRVTAPTRTRAPGGAPAPSRSLAKAMATIASRPAAPVRRAAPVKEQKPASLWQQATGLVTGMPMGLMSFGADIATDVVAPTRVAIDLIKDQNLRGISDYLPASTGLLQSAATTGQRLTHPQEYVDAAKEGRILAAIMEDIGNVAIVGGAASKLLGAGASAATMTAADAAASGARVTAPALQTAAANAGRTAISSLDEIARFAPEAELAVQPQMRGLAGYAQRAGNLEGAAKLNRVGNVVQKYSHLGATTADLPAYPYRWGMKQGAKVAERLGAPSVSDLVTRAANNSRFPALRDWGAMRDTVTLTDVDGNPVEMTRRQAIRRLDASAQRAGTQAVRSTLEAERTARRFGLSRAEGRAIGMNIEMPWLGDAARNLSDADMQTMLDRMYEDGLVDADMRPTVEDVRTLHQYKDKALGSEKMAQMLEVEDLVREQARRRTERALQSGEGKLGLNPENLDPNLRESVVAEQLKPLERRQDLLHRAVTKATGRAWREEVRAAASEQLVNELPPPPSTSDVYAQGRAAERQAGLERRVMDQYRRKVVELNRAVSEYDRLETAGDSTVTEQAARNLERLTNEADRLRSVLDRNQRRVEAGNTLSRIGGIRTPTVNKGLGRLAGDVTGARQNISIADAATRDARTMLDAAKRGDQQSIARAARGIENAADAVDVAEARLPGEGPSLAETIAPDSGGWDRHVGKRWTGQVDADGNKIYEETRPRSRNERELEAHGRRVERAEAARAQATRLQRAFDRQTDKIADYRTELGKSFQDRLVEQVNVPAVNRLRSGVRSAGPVLGNLRGELTDQADSRTLSGYIRTIAHKYGFEPHLIEALDEAARDNGGELTAYQVDVVIEQTIDELGVVLDGPDRTTLTDSIEASKLVEDIDALQAGELAEGRRLNSPYRVNDLIRQRLGSWNMPAEARSKIDKAWEAYGKKRSATLGQVYNNWTKAIPARFRTAAQAGQRQIGALIEMAEEANRNSPGDGDIYFQMAEETTNTLADMVEQGFDPEHLIGGEAVNQGSARGGGARGANLGQSVLRASRQRKSGLRQLSLDAYSRVESEQALKHITNKRNDAIAEIFGKRADEIVGDDIAEYGTVHDGAILPPAQMAAAVEAAGWVPMEGTHVTPDTILVPRGLKDHLRERTFDIPGWKLLGKANQKFKSWVLPFSPKWQVGNIIGNVIQSWANAGVSPLELATQMRAIAKGEGGWRKLWGKEGLPDWTNDEIANHGLTINEYQILHGRMASEARTPIGKLAEKSYSFNQFVDNLTRSAVDLSLLKKGVSSEAALKTTLRAMGDYSKMSSFERRFAREIFPFYAWLRHSTVAMAKLPIYSPSRAAFMLHLSDMYSDPEMSNELIAFIGSRLPLGGNDVLNLGSVFPYGELGQGGFPLAPTTLARSLSPGIKALAGVTTGIDLGNLDQVSRPTGSFRRDVFGRPDATPPIQRLFSDPVHGLGEIGWQLTQQGPSQIKTLRDLVLGDEVRYGGTGYQVGTMTDDRKRSLGALYKLTQLPTIDTVDPKQFAGR